MIAKFNSYAFKKAREDPVWYWKAKKGRMSSSNFLRIASAKKPSAVQKIIDEILNPGPAAFQPKACLMGIAEEDNARQAYVRFMERTGNPVTVEGPGLCISNDEPFLSTTPDGFVCDNNGNEWLLEIKCLYDRSLIPRKILEIAKERGSRFYCRVINDKLHLKKSHRYYCQCLGQMALTGLNKVDFTMYAPRTGEIIVTPVHFSPLDWDTLHSRLVSFRHKYFA